ncbi:hypothetical protein M9H77_07095 [Catharanthus roseus]|uniref:Uncharacterized protein n=1 Tax=Catharanthus roseus TaxID=4058 RepID=A0ACC0BTY1_CATRO|nr:hypothetical protein M9H77_07095 [Catharanthus roseus]
MNQDDQEANELIHGLITRVRTRRGDLGGREYNRPQEEVPSHEAWHGDNLFEDYGENPNVDNALDKIKWKVRSFKEESFEDSRKPSKLLILYTISKDYSMEQVGGEKDQVIGRISVEGKHLIITVWSELWVSVVEENQVLLKVKILQKLN